MTEFVRLLYRQLQATLPPTRAYSIQELRRLGLPDALVHHLQHQAIARAETMLPVLDDTWFETEAPDVQEAFQQLRNRLRSHVRIPASVWPELLGESLQALTGYLIQPIRTLTAHIFDEADSVPAAEALRRMHWFQPYAYFREAVALYVEEKQVTRLERDRFESLLVRVDRELTADFDAEAWVRLLRPLYELATLLPERPVVLPASLLIAFFTEKQRPDLVQRLQAEGTALLTAEALERLLAGKEPSAPGTAPVAEEEAEALPLWRRFQLQQAGAGEARSANEAAALPRWMQFYQQPPAEQMPAPPTAELEREVLGETGLRNRELFITHLFDGDRSAYLRVLRLLRDTPTWAEASQLIAREVFRRYQVNIYSEPAVAFTDAVERRYRKNQASPLQ
ncbi:hypothetical protein [Rhodothermus marinus]|uniref:hypothetical protein n=1 Tax=Rhodothermus marinus TaxID=29549 RepID=UPI0012BA5119|nr:hypothetical protein [Rhodothermus marinus]BBM68370.1 hypothetical protein RmaAA213_02160 [Rhodothermus marinus]BBM71339.1 hypothetical protein RmaAA338_02040 [Rhodothermus marinus]